MNAAAFWDILKESVVITLAVTALMLAIEALDVALKGRMLAGLRRTRAGQVLASGLLVFMRVFSDFGTPMLIGEGYRSPVDFWMPFNGNIGIHDMQSRYYFGGTIYLTHGSHGCVNTPLDAVEQIYNAVEEGTPVIVYEEG